MARWSTPSGTPGALGDPSSDLPAGTKAVHLEPTPTADGYWIVDDDGDVFAYGDARAVGALTPAHLLPREKVTSLSGHPVGDSTGWPVALLAGADP